MSATNVYSVWALPPEDVKERVKKLMQTVRSEYGGPEFDPHVTVVGAISLSPEDALHKFRSACQGLKPYTATVKSVSAGLFYLIDPSPEVVGARDHCCSHFGYEPSSPYMPHMSILYADFTEEEKKKAEEKVKTLDETIEGLSFPITRLALWKTDPKDTTLKSWEQITEYDLSTH